MIWEILFLDWHCYYIWLCSSRPSTRSSKPLKFWFWFSVFSSFFYYHGKITCITTYNAYVHNHLPLGYNTNICLTLIMHNKMCLSTKPSIYGIGYLVGGGENRGRGVFSQAYHLRKKCFLSNLARKIERKVERKWEGKRKLLN